MNAVGVLAVMDFHARKLARDCKFCADPVCCTDCDAARPTVEARAAVAELMDQRTELIARLTQVLPYLYVLENEGIDTAVPVRMKIEQVEAALARCVK